MQSGLLILYCVLPALVSLIAINLELAPVYNYIFGKGLMTVIPLLVWRVWRRTWNELGEELGLPGANPGFGAAMGIVMGGIALSGAYLFNWLGLIDAGQITAKIQSLGIVRFYWIAAVYFSIGNALLEEYYFRAFLLGRFRFLNWSAAVTAVVNGCVFGLHHVVVLITMMPPTYSLLLAAGTALAGGVWCYLRLRGTSIIDCYISHVMADLAIFYAAWKMIG
jgi:membrane protease YdiL (CAAX protease family)